MLAQQYTPGFGGDLYDVEPYQQLEKYSCGAAAFKAVAQHWGDRIDERTLIKEIGIDPEAGSTAGQVADAAQRRGYPALVHQFSSIDELGRYTARDIPVIVAIRSFIRPNQGHFVVATKVTPTDVHVMDPNVRGNRRTIPRPDMVRRWRFRENVGVIILPRRRRTTLGQDTSTPKKLEGKQIFALATAGLFVAITAVSAGIAIYRRRKAS
jgi:ABC-type bacteriocin/lantibiotic exporter with double-glycine peptidase domain